MSKPGFFVNGDNWIAGTRMLDPDERGIYMDLICMAHGHDSPSVPEEVVTPHTMGCHGHMLKRCLKSLQKFGKIEIKDGQITPKRVAKDLQNDPKSKHYKEVPEGSRARASAPSSLPFPYNKKKLTLKVGDSDPNRSPRDASPTLAEPAEAALGSGSLTVEQSDDINGGRSIGEILGLGSAFSWRPEAKPQDLTQKLFQFVNRTFPASEAAAMSLALINQDPEVTASLTAMMQDSEQQSEVTET